MKCLIASVSLVVLTVGCAQTGPRMEPLGVDPLTPASGEWRSTDNVIVITDASNTQVRSGSYGTAKALAQSFVAALPDPKVKAQNPGSYSVGAIGFGSDERSGAALAPFDRESLARATGTLHPLGGPSGGTTPLHDVLDETAAQLQGSSGRAAIVLFSDGLPNSNSAAIEAGRRLANGYQPGVCIHSVQTGDSSEGRAFLKQLSELTPCGSVRNASDVASGSDLLALERQVLLSEAPAERQLPAVSARPDACAGRIVLRGIQFDFARSDIREQSLAVLDAAASQLEQCPNLSLSVDGHTCSIGKEQYNDGLSRRRAESVRSYLIRAGISADRLDAKGHGESSPLADNGSEDGRTQNRRVELTPR